MNLIAKTHGSDTCHTPFFISGYLELGDLTTPGRQENNSGGSR